MILLDYIPFIFWSFFLCWFTFYFSLEWKIPK